MTRQCQRAIPLLSVLVSVVIAPAAHAAILTVGAGMQHRSLGSAIDAARDGDVVQIRAGTYTNDFALVNKRISIVGVGGMARLVANGAIPNGKGILVTNGDVTVDHIEFTGARVDDGNGAGIRYESGNLTVQKCNFRDNENGIFANSSPKGNIYISGSEFARNGTGDGYTHGVYINKIANLQITNSYFHDTRVGHHIKSRAERTVVDGNRIVDGPNGTASYSIDLPNGGYTAISGNTIVQSAASQNPALIHFGGESSPYGGSSMQVSNNILESYGVPFAVGVLNDTPAYVGVHGNKVYNLSDVVSGPHAPSGNAPLNASVKVDTSSPWRH